MAACPEKSRILQAGSSLADPDGGVDAVEIGHDDVADEHVGPKGARRFDGFFAGIYGGGFKSALVENNGQGVGNDTLVVGDQHFGFHLSLGHSFLHIAF